MAQYLDRTTHSFGLTTLALCLTCLFSVVLPAAAAEDPHVTLIGDGTTAVILVPERGPETRRAAHDLADYIFKITSRRPAIVIDGTDEMVSQSGPGEPAHVTEDAARIHVGPTREAEEAVDPTTLEALDLDGFVVKAVPAADGQPAQVYCLGRRDISNAYAVFDLLEKFGGVRWFMPGEFGEYVPRQATLRMPAGEYADEPAYIMRNFTGRDWRDKQDMSIWMTRNRIQADVRLQYHHNLWRVFDVERWGEEAPEVFPIIDGQRRIPAPGAHTSWQPNLAHPKAIDITLEYAREYFEKHPEAPAISLGVNDGHGYDESEMSMKWVDPDTPADERWAPWFFQYANKVAERFDEEFPDKKLGFLLYNKMRTIPEDVELHERLVPFDVFISYNLINPPDTEHGQTGQEFDARLAVLQDKATEFGLYDWFYGYWVTVPRLQIQQAKYYLQSGYEAGARYVKAEAYPNWGLDGFKYWIYGKLMWDPDLDVDAMRDEAIDKLFGEAAGPMHAYFRIVEEWSNKPITATITRNDGSQEERVINYVNKQEIYESFPPEVIDECEPLLDEALELARDPAVRQRVEYYRKGFGAAALFSRRYHLIKEALPRLASIDTLEEALPALGESLQPQYDIPLYYRWVIGEDPFLVRFPGEGGLRTVALRTAAETLNHEIVRRLREQLTGGLTAAHVEAVAQETLSDALADAQSSETIEASRSRLATYIGKVALAVETSAPTIDGQLDDASWADAPVYRDMLERGSGTPAKYATEFRVVHDGDRAYVAVKCYQDTSELRTSDAGRDGRLWREDSVELLFNRLDDEEPNQRFHVIVNPSGSIFDLHGDVRWNGEIDVATQIEPDYWTAEVSLPVSAVKMGPNDQPMVRFNVVRNVFGRPARQGFYDDYGVFQGRDTHLEWSTWYLTANSNTSLNSRGWLIFK